MAAGAAAACCAAAAAPGVADSACGYDAGASRCSGGSAQRAGPSRGRSASPVAASSVVADPRIASTMMDRSGVSMRTRLKPAMTCRPTGEALLAKSTVRAEVLTFQEIVQLNC